MAIGDMMGMMKQAKALQEKMEQLQQEVGAMEVEGSSGGGLVTVVMTGKSEMKRLHIDPSLIKPEDAEILEDLIVAAVLERFPGAEIVDVRVRGEAGQVAAVETAAPIADDIQSEDD